MLKTQKTKGLELSWNMNGVGESKMAVAAILERKTEPKMFCCCGVFSCSLFFWGEGRGGWLVGEEL